jgi:hypothetical protein
MTCGEIVERDQLVSGSREREVAENGCHQKN